ncbi:craniofacial development protein 2-like [Sitophilus oryzae]|uniref:Craniofacial development protein 2-like n=1 Tax=Sitophilus oryzae TaxID=7048 RepID=A0A6J2YF95_SITOR|nr:craniofacial development protein 2-like [Sitophilus oryzae]
MNIGTWNVQSISGKIEEITKELEVLKMDIVALTETKRKGNGTELSNNYVHIFSGVAKHERAKRDFESIDENIIRVNMNINQKSVTIFGVYAISDDEPYHKKDDFFGKLNEEITKIGNGRELIILGDFNGRVGRRTNNKNHKDIHKYTWTQPTRNLKSIIDYVIVRQQTTLQINDVRPYRGITCGSDHYLVKAKIKFPFRRDKRGETNRNYEHTERTESKRYNLDSLTTESTRQLYHKRLDEKRITQNSSKNNSVEEVYANILSNLHSAAEEALGSRAQVQSNNIWWNEEIDCLIKEKKNAYKKWLSSKQQQDGVAYLDYIYIYRTTRQKIRTAKREIWDKKCQEINTYLGGRKCAESWKFINQVKTSEKQTAQLQLIPMNKWKEHYEELLTENRQEYATISPTEINISGEVINIDIPQTKKAVAALKSNRGPGPENIPGELLKCGTENLFKA